MTSGFGLLIFAMFQLYHDFQTYWECQDRYTDRIFLDLDLQIRYLARNCRFWCCPHICLCTNLIKCVMALSLMQSFLPTSINKDQNDCIIIPVKVQQELLFWGTRFHPVFSVVCVTRSLDLCAMFCRSLLVVLLGFFFWPLYCP